MPPLQRELFKNSDMHFQRSTDRIIESNSVTLQGELEFLDPETRRIIGKELIFQTGTNYATEHDLPEAHKVASFYEPKNTSRIKVHVHVAPANSVYGQLLPISRFKENLKPRNKLTNRCESLFASQL